MCSDSSGTWTGSGKTWTSRLRHKCSSSVTFFLCTWTLFPALPPSLARSLTHSLAVPRGIVKSLSRPWSTVSAWLRVNRRRACSDERSPRPSSRCQPETTSHFPRSTPGGLRSLPGEHIEETRVFGLVLEVRAKIITELWKPFSILFSQNTSHGLTWHASTPPAKNPLQSILEVTWPSVTTLQTESLIIFTDAFCSSCAFWPAREAAGAGGQRTVTRPACLSPITKALMGRITVG